MRGKGRVHKGFHVVIVTGVGVIDGRVGLRDRLALQGVLLLLLMLLLLLLLVLLLLLLGNILDVGVMLSC